MGNIANTFGDEQRSMLIEFFRQASRSPSRQRFFRTMGVIHFLVLAAVILIVFQGHRIPIAAAVGDGIILLGIVEGALVVGWRLVQWPKSRALEPLLLANLSSASVMAGEQVVGLTMLASLQIVSLPLLTILHSYGHLPFYSLWLFPLQGLLWGALTGFGLVWWAYEPKIVSWWGERVIGLVLLMYFIIGGLAGEHTIPFLRQLPGGWGNTIVDSMLAFHSSNPFANMHRLANGDPNVWKSLWITSGIAVTLLVLMLIRSAYRLKSHYTDRHYRPVADDGSRRRGTIGDQPLTWWAVKRVHEYAGRVNLYLAGGAAVLYSAYLIAGPHWPTWLGSQIFEIFEQNGGVASITTILVLLTAVPAAYQYGLWDASKSDRCQRLENLLVTDLDALDYERASWAASWSRGRGYFYAALLVWTAGAVAGRITWLQMLLAMGAGWLLLLVYFIIGFRCLARNGGGASIGFFLSVILPLGTWGLASSGYVWIAKLLPPGIVYYAAADLHEIHLGWVIILALLAFGVFFMLHSRRAFDGEIRRSFEADLLRA
jgi:hypothetical protein